MKNTVQLEHATFSNIRQIWLNGNIHMEKKFILFKSLLKFALTYNVETWGLTMKEAQEIDADNQ